MKAIKIEQITIPYQKEWLQQWKERNPNIVPSFMLDWDGPGISNGYGFGEWMAEKYFRNQGYYVFTNDFNLLSKTSKFSRYNKMIDTLIPPGNLKEFKEIVQQLTKEGYSIENPDLLVFNLNTCFFAEVKKESDKVREPQLRFFYLAKQFFEIDSKLVYLCSKSIDVLSEELTFEFDLSDSVI